MTRLERHFCRRDDDFDLPHPVHDRQASNFLMDWPEGNAIVYCEGAFRTTNGKTAHGLVRRCERYGVVCVIDSTCAGSDAAEILDGEPRGIPVVTDLAAAIAEVEARGIRPTHFVVGLAPDGGRLSSQARGDVRRAIEAGLSVDCGLHDFLSEVDELADVARAHGVTIRDVRKPPPRDALHFFDGRIEQVDSFKVAILGTDSAIGKRTTAWLLVDALRAAGRSAELIGTGQTAWLQGARYGIVLDALVNDFVAGEIEHAVWSAWSEQRPDVIVVEGQGSLMNPAFPGGLEILAAARPDVIVLQHAPARKEYDGFPGYPLHAIETQIAAIEMIGEKPVVAVTINHEDLAPAEIPAACEAIAQATGLPAFDVLRDGGGELASVLSARPEFGSRAKASR